MVDILWWKDLVKGLEDPLIREGCVRLPEKPGLGIELDEANVRKHLVEGEKYFE
jgi:L-alanine-DL-glutamate epimerase-like enolase superfamily enzyme